MTKEQIDREFEAIVKPQTNELTVVKLSSLMDLVHEMGAWPDDEAPKLVGRLWK